MLSRLIVSFLFLCSITCYAQESSRISSFENKFNNANDDVERIKILAELSEYYSIYNLQPKADSVLQKALVIAEESSDKELILKILFATNISNLNSFAGSAVFEHSVNLVNKGLQYAQQINRNDFVALAYIRLAGIYRKKNDYEKAMSYATQAYTALAEDKYDSIRCVLYLEMGDIYISKDDAVPAFKNYSNAYRLAYMQKNISLQSTVYHSFSELYKKFGDVEMAKKYLLQSLDLNNEYKNKEGLFNDYFDLIRLTDKLDYFDKAAALAQKLQSDKLKLRLIKLKFYWLMVKAKNSETTFGYLYANEPLLNFFKNSGAVNYKWQIGNIYRYAGKFDSALIYFKNAESFLDATSEPATRINLLKAMADTYYDANERVLAMEYYLQCFKICKDLKWINYMPDLCSKLQQLQVKEGDYRLAYYYNQQGDSVENILEEKSAKDKVVLLQVDQENKKVANDLQELALAKDRKHNLQIMAITLLLTLIFAVMLFIGMFAVSKTSIRLLGYFAFISLFEFIILLIDHPIVTFTNGEPLKIWCIKIVLIAMLVPCQHFMEHRLIGFLQSRKLLEARQRISFTNWWKRLKKPSTVEGIENDTAVL